MDGKDYLLLKWGTVKGWEFQDADCTAFQLLKEYAKVMTRMDVQQISQAKIRKGYFVGL